MKKTTQNIVSKMTFKKFIFSLVLVLGVLAVLGQVNALATSDFKVNDSTSIIGTSGVTNLTFTGFIDDPNFRPYGCDMNLYDQNHTYVGPYPAPGQAGVGVPLSGAGNFSFTGQNQIFSYPSGGYYFRLTCFEGTNNYSKIWEVYGDFQDPTATLGVTSSNCSAAGLSWTITPENISGSGTSGNYVVHPGGGRSYTISASPSVSGYTTSVTNSDGGGSTVTIYPNQNKSFNVSCIPPDQSCQQPVSTTLTCGSGYSNPNSTYTQTTTYGPSPSCPATVTDNKNSVCIPLVLPACTVDSFPDQWEAGGVVSPTWATSNSNNVVLSGGQFGSGVAVEPDGYRSINISSDVTLTITANAGATCSPSASRSAVMHAESVPPPPPGGSSCSITYFPDDGEDGNGWAYPQWQSNATTLTLSGGPFSNTSVPAPNHNPDSSVKMAISTNTWLTLSGNGGQCTDTALFYAAAPAPTPSNFAASAGSCGTNQIFLSWGQSPGAGSYVLFRNGTKIWEGGNYGSPAYTDTGLTAGYTYSYDVYSTSPNGNSAPASLSAVAPSSCPVLPTVTLNANPTSVSYNSASTLSWTSTNATSCTASGGWTGTKVTAGSASTGNLTTNTTYTLTCTGSGGTSAPVSVTIAVSGPPPATPSGFTVTGSSCGNNWLNLSWYASSGATNYKVYRDGGGTPIYNGDGSNIQLGGGAMGFSDTGLTPGTSHNYTVTASNANGTSVPASGSGQVAYNCAVPTASITVSPSSVSYNGVSTITWSSTNATSCTASNGWSGTKTTSGSESTGTLTSNKTYTLICTGAGGDSLPVSASVTVGSAPPTFDFSLSDPGGVSITKGQSGQNTITASLVAGSAEPISFSFANYPSGISPSASTCSPSGSLPCTSTLTHQVGSTVNAQSYYVRVIGTGVNSGVSHYRDFYLTVTNPTGIVATCSVNKSTAKVGESVGWSVSVSGGTPPYTTYAWSGSGVPSPAPTTSSFSTTYSTTGTKTSQVTVTDSAGAQGTCTPVSTTINFDPTIIEF